MGYNDIYDYLLTLKISVWDADSRLSRREQF